MERCRRHSALHMNLICPQMMMNMAKNAEAEGHDGEAEDENHRRQRQGTIVRFR